MKGSGKKVFWKAELERAITMVNADKKWFKQQYKGFKGRCQAHGKSKDKRLKAAKW